MAVACIYNWHTSNKANARAFKIKHIFLNVTVPLCTCRCRCSILQDFAGEPTTAYTTRMIPGYISYFTASSYYPACSSLFTCREISPSVSENQAQFIQLCLIIRSWFAVYLAQRWLLQKKMEEPLLTISGFHSAVTRKNWHKKTLRGFNASQAFSSTADSSRVTQIFYPLKSVKPCLFAGVFKLLAMDFVNDLQMPWNEMLFEALKWSNRPSKAA